MTKPKHTHLVIHWSQNWINDPHIEYCTSLKSANKYVETFQSKSKEHKDDIMKVVALLSEHAVSEIDHGLYGVKKTN
jgi:hypothetical protein